MTEEPRPPVVEVWTVAEDGIVVHHGDRIERRGGLPPGQDVLVAGRNAPVRTLERPGGELLCRFATVNDVHFGETECGRIDEVPDLGPILAVEDGEAPYPEVMNRGVVEEVQAAGIDVLVAKGDLTADGRDVEYQAFLDCYGAAFGDGLLHVRGNHDAMHGQTFATGPSRLDLPGVTIALLDTARPGRSSGWIDDDQLDWLDTLAAEADRPVLAMGHHQAWSPDSTSREDGYFGIHPDPSERLVEIVARRPRILGWFAGHTHRNRVRHFAATGAVPWVEVGCTKDFPGSWAEYRVYEGGVLQVHHRISTPDALAWSDRCRAMLNGLYQHYSAGTLEDRCFAIPLR